MRAPDDRGRGGCVGGPLDVDHGLDSKRVYARAERRFQRSEPVDSQPEIPRQFVLDATYRVDEKIDSLVRVITAEVEVVATRTPFDRRDCGEHSRGRKKVNRYTSDRFEVLRQDDSVGVSASCPTREPP